MGPPSRLLVVAVAILLTPLSGCSRAPAAAPASGRVTPPATDESIDVPRFYQGDAWTTRITQPEGDGTSIVDVGSTLVEGIQDVRDAFGQIVPGYLLEDVYNPVQPLRNPVVGYRSVEASRLVWLATDYMGVWELSMHLDGGVPILFPISCDYHGPSVLIPIFDESPFSIDFGSLRGRTVKLGEPVVQSVNYQMGTTHVKGNLTFRPTERMNVSFDGRIVDAMWVDVESKYDRRTDGSGGVTPLPYSRFPATRLLLGHGIPIPLRAELGPHVLELRSFSPGRTPLLASPETAHGQFRGIRNDSRPMTMALAPDTSGIPLPFTFDEALAVMRASPRAAYWLLWMSLHPEAYVGQATFFRDVANQTYRWTLRFIDDAETYSVWAERRILGEGLKFEDAAGTSNLGFPNTFFPSPSEARTLPLVELHHMADFGAKILNQTGWAHLGWLTTFHERETRSRLFVEFWIAPGARAGDRTGPFVQGRGEGIGPSVDFSAATGRIKGSSSGSLSCDTSLTLQP